LSDSFPIQNGLKQGDALSPLLSKFAFIRKVQEDQVGLILNGTYQLLASDVNLVGDNIDAIKKAQKL
jgi:hypothetical protein